MARRLEERQEPGRRILEQPWARATLPFALGGCSGMFATMCVQPIDMVKVRLQLCGEGARAGPKPTAFGLAKDIVANGRYLDLYTGLSAGLLRQAVYATARLGFFDTFLAVFQRRADARGSQVSFVERAAAGLAAGGCGAMVGNPTEVALIRMQSDGTKPKHQRANYRSVFDVLARIAKDEGIRGWWRGASPTVVRAMATNFGQLAFFSETKNQLQKYTDLGPKSQAIVASAVAGFFASFFSLPFDFIKTRMQRQSRGPDGRATYNSLLDCFFKVAKEEGLLRFYRGFGTYFLRIAPHTIINLIVLDNLKILLKIN